MNDDHVRRNSETTVISSVQPEQLPGPDIAALKACINDLIGIVALPAIWNGQEPSQIVRTLLDTVLRMLRLDIIYVRLTDRAGDTAVEMARLAESRDLMPKPGDIWSLIVEHFGDDSSTWPQLARLKVNAHEMSVVPVRLGIHGEIGILVAASRRGDFPGQTEKLLLNVAANQAAIGLQEAWLLSEFKSVAQDLDQQVAERTKALALANEDLQKENEERRRAEWKLHREERRLKQSEALLAEAQRLSATGSFTRRVVTGEITWSDQTYRIFELDFNTPVTIDLISSRIHPDDLSLFRDSLKSALVNRGDFEFDVRLQLPGNTVKHVHIVARTKNDADGNVEYTTGSIQDVTERRRSEEALSEVRSELAHMARVTSLGALTASIAHEVNQPLAGIVTNAGTSLRMLTADPPNIEGACDSARRIIRDANRASEVITRLRALFRKSRPMYERVDLNEATREVIALLSSELKRKRVILRAELSDILPPVTGDRVQIQQVILNLLGNASDALSGIEDRPRELQIDTAQEKNDLVRLTVRDTGAGIAADEIDHLFEAFYTTKSSGMGIGLSVSRSIIESHDGRLWAEVNDGPGATFSFVIPSRVE